MWQPSRPVTDDSKIPKGRVRRSAKLGSIVGVQGARYAGTKAANVGRSEDVVQVRDIAEMVREAVPGSTLSIADGAGPDLRNYKVDFSKLNETFPGLQLQWTVRKGVYELYAAYQRHGLTLDRG